MNLTRWWVLAAALAFACHRPGEVRPTLAPPPTPSAAVPRVDPEPWRTTAPTPGRPGSLTIPQPEVSKLANGLTVYTVHQPVHIVSLLVVTRQGAGSVPPGKSGLAGLTARMLTEGTTRRSSDALAVAAEDLGSELSADAGRDYSLVGMTVLREDLDAAVGLLGEVIREPAFDAGELDRVRAEWVDGLIAERQSPERLSTLAGLRLLLGPTHGAPVGGSVPEVKALGAADLRTHYARHFVAEDMAVVAVGDVTSGEVTTSVERHFARLPRRAPAAPSRQPLPTAAGTPRRILLVDRPDAVQSAICAVQHLPPRSAPGYEAREVLNTVLGGMFTSRLNQNLREAHSYTYGVSSLAVATRAWGAFIVMTTVEAQATQRALDEIVKELDDAASAGARRPFADAELERARAALVNAQASHLESLEWVAQDVATLFVHDLPNDYYATYEQRIRSVTRAMVEAEAETYLKPDRLGVVIVGPRGEIEPGLRTPAQSVETATPDLLE